jgi:hypothetical protein
MTRRAFLGQGACSVVLATTMIGPVSAVAETLLSPPAEVRFGTDRAFVGDRVKLFAQLPGRGPIHFRLVGSEGWSGVQVAEEASPLARSVELIWRVERTSVPLRPGVHPIQLMARRGERGRWIAATAPLEVLINRFAFGL